jgi:hypothetical protein
MTLQRLPSRPRRAVPSTPPSFSSGNIIAKLRALQLSRLARAGTTLIEQGEQLPPFAPTPQPAPVESGGGILGFLQGIPGMLRGIDPLPDIPIDKVLEGIAADPLPDIPIDKVLEGIAADPLPNIPIDKVLEGIAFVEEPAAAAGSAISHQDILGMLRGVDPLPDIPGDIWSGTVNIPGLTPEAETKQLVQEQIGRLFSGKQGFFETRQQLQNIQQARPTTARIVSEIAGPFGLVEALAPFGLASKIVGRTARLPGTVGRAIPTSEALTSAITGGPKLTAARTADIPARTVQLPTTKTAQFLRATPTGEQVQRNILELPSVPDVMKRISTGTVSKNLDRLPFMTNADKVAMLSGPIAAAFRMPFKVLNRNSILNLDDPANVFRAAYDQYAELAPEAGTLVTRKLGAIGDPKDMFRLDPQNGYRSQLAGDFNNLTFNEIAERLDEFAPKLTPEQNAWFKGFGDLLDEMNEYLISQGVPRDALFAGTRRNYFPRIYKMFKDIELKQSGRGGLGATPFYEKFRAYEFIEDALQEGFQVGDPMEAVELLFTSMYKQVADERLMDIIRPYGFTINRRIDPKILEVIPDARARLDGVQQASTFIRNFSTRGIERAPTPGAALKGRAIAEQQAPGLMARLDEIAAIPKITDRRAAFKELRSEAAKELNDARKYLQNARKVATEARRRAQPRGFMGEMQAPGTGLGGRIWTPDDLADHINPEGLLADFQTLPRESLAEMQKVLRGPTKDWLDAASSISAVSRVMQAGLDLGVGTIHLLPLMFTRPATWGRAMDVSLQAMKDPQTMSKFLDDHWSTVQELFSYNQLHSGGSEYVEALQSSGLLHRGARKIPGPPGKAIMRGLEGFEAQFNGALVASKILLWEGMRPMFAPGQLNDLASHIAKMTGTMSMANMGVLPGVRKTLGALMMFAPRYRMATYGLMLDIFRGGVAGSLAREQMGKMMAGGLLFYSVAAHRMKQPMNLDPTKGSFATLKFGDTNIGFGSAYVSISRFTASFLKQAITDPNAAARIDRRDNRLQRFIRGQLSPVAGIGVDVATGRNFIGDPTTDSIPNFFSNVVAENTMPFYLSGLADYPSPGWGGSLGEFGGLRAFPVSLFEQARDMADLVSAQETGTRYQDLTPAGQMEFRNEHPDIQERFDEANALWARRGSGIGQQMATYRNRLTKFIDDVYQPQLQEVINIFEKQLGGPGQGERLRRRVGELGFLLGQEYERLATEFPEVEAALNEQGADPDANVGDLAYLEYLKDVVLADFDITDPLTGEKTGEFDFQSRELAERAIRGKYGEDVWEYIQRRRVAAKQSPPILLELQQGRDILKPYWEVGESILDTLGRPELKPTLRAYKKANAEERTLMAEQNPVLRQVTTASTRARQEYRRRHADVDAFLIRWDYPGRLQHQDNKGRDLEEIERTPVWLGNGS